MKVYIKNQQRVIKVSPQRLARFLRKVLHLLGLHRAELSILLVNDRRMKLLNRQYRSIDRATDVLSFPQTENRTQNFVLGDIVIDLPRAKKQAGEQGITLNEELKRLMIHGLLHLIGYDHEKSRYQKNKMRSKERELFDLLASL